MNVAPFLLLLFWGVGGRKECVNVILGLNMMVLSCFVNHFLLMF